MTPTLRECVDICNNRLLPMLETMFYKGQKVHPDKTILIDSITELINLAEFYLRIAELEGIPKQEIHKHDSIPTYTGNVKEGCVTCIRNQAIQETILAIMKKMEGLEEVLANLEIDINIPLTINKNEISGIFRKQLCEKIATAIRKEVER